MTGPVDNLVLIADDQVEIGDVIRLVVEDLVGSRAVTATNGEEAVQLARQLMPDLIILDLMMPRLNGVETIEMLKANEATRAIPVIAVTAADPNRRRSALAAGCVCVISKPFDVFDLAGQVQEHLADITAQAS